MRILVVPFAIAFGLLVIALLLPTRHDKNVAMWWARVRYQADFFARVVLVIACVAGIVWYVVLPILGWQVPGRVRP